MSDHCLLYIVRHGATPHNLFDPPRMQGRHIDESLDELGRAQASEVARVLSTRDLAAVYTSPLKRAMETAMAIAQPHDIRPVAVAGLAEADVGRWEDRAWPEIAENDAEAYLAFREDPVANGYPGGEDLRTVTNRVKEAIDEFAAGHLGQQVAVSAHSVVNRLYLGELLHVPMAMRRKVPQDNCCISIVEWRPDKQRVITLNAVDHLSP